MQDNYSDSRTNKPKSPVTREDVDIIVKSAFDNKVDIVDYEVKGFSEEKLGFLGTHDHLIVTVRRDGKTEERTFFLKSVPYDIEEQAELIRDTNVFFKESNFYKKILPELTRSVKKTSSLTAQCYLAKDDALVFEDLTLRNFGLTSKFIDDTAFLKSGITALAKLHASSILAEKRLGQPLRKIYPGVLNESLYSLKGKSYEWFKTSITVSVGLAKYLGLDHSNIPLVCDAIFDAIATSRTRQNVVCHGDAKSYNIMFDGSRPLPKCVLLDFQLVRYAPPMTDLLQFMYLNTRRRVREKNEEELLRHYHEVFCHVLRENDKEISMPGLDEILQEYEELRVVGVVTAATYAPANCMDGKECAELTKDSDGFAKLLRGDRVQFVLDIMKKDPAYREILTEIITEMVQRSKQLIANSKINSR